MAQLGAIKTLEQLDDEQQAASSHKSLPGLQIVVQVNAPAQAAAIDVTPAIDARLTHEVSK